MNILSGVVCFAVVATPAPNIGQSALVLTGYTDVDVAREVRDELVGYTSDIATKIISDRFEKSPEGIRAAKEALKEALQRERDIKSGKIKDYSSLMSINSTAGYLKYWQKVTVIPAPQKDCS